MKHITHQAALLERMPAGLDGTLEERRVGDI